MAQKPYENDVLASARMIAFNLDVSRNAVNRWVNKRQVLATRAPDGSWQVSLRDTLRHVLDTPTRFRVPSRVVDNALHIRELKKW
jgi:hypothetical protein